MAAASTTIWTTNNKIIRTYGGNRGDVKWMAHRYRTMTLEEFLAKHPSYTEDDYKNLKVTTNFNKR